MIYVLVSGTFEITDTPHKGLTFGQRFEFTDTEARQAVLEGVHLVPKETFDSFEFTLEEIAKYSNARRQANAPPEFHAKLAKAIQAAKDYRIEMEKPPVEAEPEPISKSEVTS